MIFSLCGYKKENILFYLKKENILFYLKKDRQLMEINFHLFQILMETNLCFFKILYFLSLHRPM
jgi:hypothetical protein